MGTRIATLRVARGVLEALALAVALASAFVFRFDGAVPPRRVSQFLVMVLPVVALQLAALRAARTHRQSWQYTSLHDLVRVGVGLTAVGAVLVVLRAVIGSSGAESAPRLMSLPYGIILADLVLAFVALSGLRVLRRLQSERAEVQRRAATGVASRRVLLVGAGRAGVMVAKEIAQRPDLGLVPVGYVDDDPHKDDRTIAGLPVLGTTDELPRLARELHVDEIIITIASLKPAGLQQIVDACEGVGIKPKIIPGLYEIVGGQVNLNRIRPVAIEDLLGRDQVELDVAPLHDLIADRSVMVTGAGGSIGAELARQVARYAPARLVLVDQAEPALWAIHRELEADHPRLRLVAAIADVCDERRVEGLFDEHRPDLVLHAAAHKHVPIMEDNPGEAIRNNVGGTKVVADLAARSRVERFVFVSTDKAVNPSSVMGATKRIAERYVQDLAHRTGLNFVSVRFGNVLGSTGSVIPIFREQVAAGGPVTVTHPEMRRYFMTVPEAAALVLQAATIGQPGEILVLDMGDPVRIVDLAEDMIRLSGFEPYRDIDIVFTGLRPGEKLFEELSLTTEGATRTRHPKIWIGRNGAPAWATIEEDLQALWGASYDAAPGEVRALLAAIVPEYTGAERPPRIREDAAT